MFQAHHLNWREVVAELDHPNFLVLNKKGLRILLQGLKRGLQDMFPVEYIYRPWKNTEGQVSKARGKTVTELIMFRACHLRQLSVFCSCLSLYIL